MVDNVTEGAFIIYLSKQGNEIFASAEYAGESEEILEIGSKIMMYINTMNHFEDKNILINPRLGSLQVQ